MQGFLNFIGDRISKPREDIINNSFEFAVKRHLEWYREGKNLTLCYGSSNTYDIFYPKDNKDGKIYLNNWQHYKPGKGAIDLALYMGMSWYPERRRRLEKDLLEKYYEILEKLGVEIKQFGTGKFVNQIEITEETKQIIKEAWEEAKASLNSDLDLLVLDELNVVLGFQILDLIEVVNSIKNKKKKPQKKLRFKFELF